MSINGSWCTKVQPAPSYISVTPIESPFCTFYNQVVFGPSTLLQYFIESNPHLGLVIYWCSRMLELDIIIVGAGIAGLASAIALSRAGHNVQASTFCSRQNPNRNRTINKMYLRFWRSRHLNAMLVLWSRYAHRQIVFWSRLVLCPIIEWSRNDGQRFRSNDSFI